jgi:hypothetical protein
MSIGVHCDQCGKTYQVRDNMAGRRGRCPNGHAITVPAATESAPAEENAFAFAFSAAPAATPKSARRRPAPAAQPEPEPAPAVDATDDFSFPSHVPGCRRDDAPAPKSGRHRPDRKAAAKEGKPNLMPLILGGILAVLGIGGGVTLLVVSRGAAGPLKEQAEAANKKAAAAEERAQKAESLKLVAEADLDKLKKSPPKDPALAEAQAKLKAAEKRAADAEKKARKGDADAVAGEAIMPAKDLDPSAPGGKADPVMPSGKLESDRPGKGKEIAKGAAKDAPDKPAADMPDGAPTGGKNWIAPGSVMVGPKTLKAGDRIWLWPQQDAALKAVGGKLAVKFRWQLRKGKELPPKAGATLMIQEAKLMKAFAAPITLTGVAGEMEVVFDVKDIKDSLPVYFFIGDGKADNPTVSSSMMSFQADFGPAK